MKKVKIKVEEVTAVQITMEEFVELASKQCVEILEEVLSLGVNEVPDILIPIFCAKFAAGLTDKLFYNEETDKEEREEK